MQGLLRFFGWATLILGSMSSVYTIRVLSQLGEGLWIYGVGGIISSILIWALLLVIATMADRLENVENGVDVLLQRTPAPSRGPAKSYSVMDRISQ